jgi:hypothetical protein
VGLPRQEIHEPDLVGLALAGRTNEEGNRAF